MFIFYLTIINKYLCIGLVSSVNYINIGDTEFSTKKSVNIFMCCIRCRCQSPCLYLLWI